MVMAMLEWIKHTWRTPLWATSCPTAMVAPPARKLEWWNWPCFFSATYIFLEGLRTKIHLEPSTVFRSTPLCLYTSFPSSITTSYASLSFCNTTTLRKENWVHHWLGMSVRIWVYFQVFDTWYLLEQGTWCIVSVEQFLGSFQCLFPSLLQHPTFIFIKEEVTIKFRCCLNLETRHYSLFFTSRRKVGRSP